MRMKETAVTAVVCTDLVCAVVVAYLDMLAFVLKLRRHLCNLVAGNLWVCLEQLGKDGRAAAVQALHTGQTCRTNRAW